MSRKANPITIGIFVTGGLTLLAALLIFFGAMNFLRPHERVVMYFDESVNGLNVGSAVKFKGVPVGRVVSIQVRLPNQKFTSTAVPVVAEFDKERLASNHNVDLDFSDRRAFAEQVEAGLRAKLEMESFITGLLYIELGYQPQVEYALHQDGDGLMEIPTVRSQLEEVTEKVTQAITRIGSIDFESLSASVSELLELIAQRTEDFDAEAITASLSKAADSISKALESGEIESTLASTRASLEKLRELAAQLDESAQTLTPELTQTLAEAREALTALQEFTAGARGALAPESSLRRRLDTTLREISNTAIALGRLAEYLERNPEALLRGRANSNRE